MLAENLHLDIDVDENETRKGVDEDGEEHRIEFLVTHNRDSDQSELPCCNNLSSPHLTLSIL